MTSGLPSRYGADMNAASVVGSGPIPTILIGQLNHETGPDSDYDAENAIARRPVTAGAIRFNVGASGDYGQRTYGQGVVKSASARRRFGDKDDQHVLWKTENTRFTQRKAAQTLPAGGKERPVKAFSPPLATLKAIRYLWQRTREPQAQPSFSKMRQLP
jgi:hypothetical protein